MRLSLHFTNSDFSVFCYSDCVAVSCRTTTAAKLYLDAWRGLCRRGRGWGGERGREGCGAGAATRAAGRMGGPGRAGRSAVRGRAGGRGRGCPRPPCWRRPGRPCHSLPPSSPHICNWCVGVRVRCAWAGGHCPTG